MEITKKCGKYELIEEIARGGSGVVYKARDPELDRVVALKVLQDHRMTDPQHAQRFAREARLTATLDHDGIVKIFDAGVHDQQPYFTMPLVDGEPLDQIIQKRGLTIRQAVELAARCARTLAYAHGQGVVHRDIKPSNILVRTDGSPVLADFGIAKHLTQSTPLTQTGETMGTPQYMPPEPIRGDMSRCDARSDIYSLGAVLIEMLTGEPPVEGATYLDISEKILNDDPIPPSRKNPLCHRDLDAICMKAMQFNPARRYQTAAELSEELERFLRGEAIQTHPEPAFVRDVRRTWRRHRVVTVLAGILVIVAGWKIVTGIQDGERIGQLQIAQALTKGNHCKEKGDADGAMRAYSQALKLDPDNKDARRGMGDACALKGMDVLAKGDLGRAKDYLERARAASRTDMVKHLEGKIKEAEAREKQ